MRRHLSAVVFLGLTVSGCDLFTGNKDKSIALSIDSPSVTVGQTETANIVVTVNRTNFDQPVTLAAEGALPQGVTATFTVNPVPNGTPTTTLRIAAAGTATPGSATITVRATGDGVTEQTVTIDVTVNVTGSYTLDVLSPSVSVAQGGGGDATVLLARSGGNAGNVTLSVEGVPTGVAAAFAQSPTTEKAVSLTIAAGTSVAAGTYPLLITSTSPGFTAQTKALSLVVLAPSSTAAIAIPFCADNMPVWFAYQNEGFLWQRVTPTDNRFNFAATQKVAIAYVFASGNQSAAIVFFASRPELSGISDRDCDGTKTHPGTVSGLTAGQTAIVIMGANGTSTTGSSYTLDDINARALDLVATRGLLTQSSFTPDKMIVRRGLNLSSGSAIPVLDFTATESFAPATATLTVTGFESGAQVVVFNDLWSATATYGAIHFGAAAGGTATVNFVPGAQLQPGDMHQLYVDSYQSNGAVGKSTVAYFGAPTDRTEALGPLLTVPTVTLPTTAPYSRFRGQLASQPEYPTAVSFEFAQGLTSNKSVLLAGTAAYFGARPNTWDLIIPDFSAVTAFNSGWMLGSGTTEHSTVAFSAREDVLFGAIPAPGEFIKLAYRTSVTSALRQQFRAPAIRERRAPLLTQYLSR